MLQDYDTSFSRVYFSRPRLFSSPSLFSPVPTFFSPGVARSSSLYRLLFDLLPGAGSSSLQKYFKDHNEIYSMGTKKTFPELQRTAPYSIEKVECVGHIQKRMGARLRKLKTMNRGKKLSDGKSISGKNRLTDKFIDTITTYYGNAIRQNNSSISDMR
ncbi:uncharacterized protein TNCV_2614811 [Trichonephila clavipes]|nr:uncharacterized protein TNCV_2614811 [Trichonephila clavipes]